MQTNKDFLLQLEAYVNNKFRTISAEVHRALGEAPLAVWQRDYIVLEQIVEAVYSQMLDNPQRDPVALAKEVMDEMYAEFIDGLGKRSDSSFNPNT